MSRGFGTAQPKRRSYKKPSGQKTPQVEQRHLEKTPPTLEKDWQINLEKQAIAWFAGAYNPLFDIEPDRIRSIEVEEEEWLFLARAIGWLKVDNELEALYFTAPPPTFDEAQADWYLRPILTTFLDEPAPLKEVMNTHEIPHHLVDRIIARHAKRLKWKTERVAAFIKEVTGQPGTDLLNEDYTAILLELQRL